MGWPGDTEHLFRLWTHPGAQHIVGTHLVTPIEEKDGSAFSAVNWTPNSYEDMFGKEYEMPLRFGSRPAGSTGTRWLSLGPLRAQGHAQN